MNKVLFFLSVIAAAASGYYVGKNDENSANIIASQDVSPSKDPRFLNIDCENNFHGGVESGAVIPSVATASSSAANEYQSMQEQMNALKAEYELKQRAEGFTQWLIKNQQEKAWFDLGIEMRGRFDAEETDHTWALEQESHLQSLFSQVPTLAGIALKSTHCKSTQCQITISVMDNDHANETAMAISQVLSREGAAQIIIDNQAQQGEAILYVARNEKGFEFN